MTTQSTSEADMGYIRDMVSKIAEALVQATELPKQIALMQNDLTALHQDLEKTKARNIELDALVSDIRRQRDEAEQSLSQVKAQLSQAQAEANDYHTKYDNETAQTNHLREQLEQAKKERDDYGLKHMEAEDRAKTAEDKLAKLAEALGLPKAAPPVDNPKPQPPAWGSVVQEAPKTVEPAPQAESSPNPASWPTAEPKKVYEGDYGFSDLNHHTEKWDNSTHRYYRTA